MDDPSNQTIYALLVEHKNNSDSAFSSLIEGQKFANNRTRKLERWRDGIIGYLACVSTIGGVLMWVLK